MKIMMLLSAFAVLSVMACSKSGVGASSGNDSITVLPASSVPAPVTAALARDFSGATEVEWHKRSGSATFSAQFNQSGERHEAGFDDSGHQQSHSIICFDGAVPAAVLDAFRQRFPNDNVYEWKLANDGTWKAHFLRSGVKYEATFSASGTLIKFEQSR
ncbi:MAG: hypothetical protein U0U70_10450 [Chitinophagaceae bacterium]